MENPPNREKQILETIAEAALIIDGRLYTGKNHPMIIASIQETDPDFEIEQSTALEDGFITSTGRFVDRTEAAEIAEKADQITKTPHDKDGDLEPWKKGEPLDSWDVKNLNYGD